MRGPLGAPGPLRLPRLAAYVSAELTRRAPRLRREEGELVVAVGGGKHVLVRLAPKARAALRIAALRLLPYGAQLLASGAAYSLGITAAQVRGLPAPRASAGGRRRRQRCAAGGQ